MNIDEMVDQISKLWEDKKEIRKIIMHTGKGGAILAYIELQDGTYLYKTKDDRRRIENWIGGKRVYYKYITNEEANKILKDPNTKEIE